MKISVDRLVSTFLDLVHIDAVSRNEKDVKDYLYSTMKDYVLTIHEDKAGDVVYGNCGNLFMKVRGSCQSAPTVILSAHMDTISSTRNLRVINANGKISSDGSTILGADNRLGLALICEVVKSLQDNKEKFGNIEIVISICEEIGLLGIKNFDFSQLKGQCAYVLDSGNTKVGVMINQAPSAVRFDIDVIGKAAHAGIAPENGVNAIAIASKALAVIPQGKVDSETTLNIGFIEGGKAVNIVPDSVNIKGEIRSYSEHNIHKYWNDIQSVFTKAASEFGGDVVFNCREDYKYYIIEPESDVIRYARQAFGGDLELISSFGGSDANVFNQNGVQSVVMGIGSWEPHTNEEYVIIDEMATSAELLYNIILEAKK